MEGNVKRRALLINAKDVKGCYRVHKNKNIRLYIKKVNDMVPYHEFEVIEITDAGWVHTNIITPLSIGCHKNFSQVEWFDENGHTTFEISYNVLYSNILTLKFVSFEPHKEKKSKEFDYRGMVTC